MDFQLVAHVERPRHSLRKAARLITLKIQAWPHRFSFTATPECVGPLEESSLVLNCRLLFRICRMISRPSESKL